MAGASRKKQDTDSRKGTAARQKNTSAQAAGSRAKGGAGRPGAGRSRAAAQPLEEENSFMGTEVAIIVTFAVSVLLFLSNFGLCGAVGDFCRKTLLGVFGSIGYVAPILLFTGACFYLSNRGDVRAVIKMTAMAAVLLALCGLSQMMFGGGLKEGWKLTAYFMESGASGSGGGLIGGILVVLLAGSLGNVGAYLVLFVLLAIGAVCVTERSLVNLVKQGGEKAYEYAREDMSRRRELHEERKEERARLREEQRVRGVNLGATRLADDVLMRDFTSDIPEGTVLGPDTGGYDYDEDMAPEGAGARPQSPADVFRGVIHRPGQEDFDAAPEEEPAGGWGEEPCMEEGRPAHETFFADEEIPMQDFPAQEIPVQEAADYGLESETKEPAGKVPEPKASRKLDYGPEDGSDSDQLLKHLYIRRDVRTFEELAGDAAGGAGADVARTGAARGNSAAAGPGRDAARAQEGSSADPAPSDGAAAGQGGSAGNPAGGRTPDIRDGSAPGRAAADAVLAGGASAGAPDAVRGANVPGAADAVPGGGMRPEPQISAGRDGAAARSEERPQPWRSEHAYVAAAEDLGDAGDVYGGDAFIEEDAEGFLDIRPEDGLSLEHVSSTVPVRKETPGAPSSSASAFVVPEEAKRVVTTSGKVIETDTEAVRKVMEQKREERKNLPDRDTVPELISKKAETVKAVKKEYIFPPLDLLKRGERNTTFSDKEYRETAIKLQQTLQNFGVGVTVTNISCGPSVTRYELHPEQGVKVSKIVGLADDIKLSLAAADIRIEAPIPGKSAVGIEVPNKENQVVLLRELLETEDFRRHPSRMAFAVGKDIGGQAVVTDIAKMPHLLIAGATGSGKSVCINTLIMSVIYKAKPEDVKLIMVDPKVVELSVYNGIPHLLIPVVTDPKKASGALNWAVGEMMDRYAKFAKYNVRDLKGYNEKIQRTAEIDDGNKPEKLPQIVIIVDELADLMMVAPGEVEDAICRLAQLARAAGIHLVIATQRPSVNVITGLIKANVPSRIAFSVSSGVDSRTIIDMNGAEKLLGKGDMLFYPSGYQKPQRVQGAFVSDQEVSAVVEFLTEQGLTAEYSADVQSRIGNGSMSGGDAGRSEQDAYFAQAGRFIIEKDKASIGMLQRMFKIGFNRAARIMDQLADAGVVGEEEGTKPRKILMSMEEFENMLEEE